MLTDNSHIGERMFNLTAIIHFYYTSINTGSDIRTIPVHFVVDAGAVASFIFEESDIELKNLLKVVIKSEPMPLGPFVVSSKLDPDLADDLKEILLSMNQSPEGVSALKKADLEGFTVFRDDDYDSLRELYSQSDNN